VSNAVVYTDGTDRYWPRFGCNVWCLRGPDKRNLNREISQRDLSSHDSSVLPSSLLPSPLLRPYCYGSYYYPTLLLRLLCLSALLSTWLPAARRLLVTAKREKKAPAKNAGGLQDCCTGSIARADDLMSALGQKQTYAPQQAMSALRPIATTKADICQWACPLYPRKRTCAVQTGMSALGQ
jgi:hypothetical protein